MDAREGTKPIRARSRGQYGCERVTLQTVNSQEEINDYGFDAPRIERVSDGTSPKATKTGGPARGIEARGLPMGRP